MSSVKSGWIVAIAVGAAAIGWAVKASYSSAAEVGERQESYIDGDWLAQAPPPEDRIDRPGRPPRDGFDRPGPPPGEGGFPELRERMEQLRRIQEQLRELASESTPDQETLRRLARQMEQALSPPAQQMREGQRERWQGFMRRGRGPEDRRRVDRMPKEMRPKLEAGAQARMAQAHLEFVELMQRLVSNPLQTTIVAVRSIVDMSKDNPKQGIGALQPLLDQEQTVATRTVIRMGLRDLYDKAGDREAALDQLAAVAKENAAAMKEHEQRRPPPPPPAQR